MGRGELGEVLWCVHCRLACRWLLTRGYMVCITCCQVYCIYFLLQVIDQCHEGGAISPATCVYMKEWLDKVFWSTSCVDVLVWNWRRLMVCGDVLVWNWRRLMACLDVLAWNWRMLMVCVNVLDRNWRTLTVCVGVPGLWWHVWMYLSETGGCWWCVWMYMPETGECWWHVWMYLSETGGFWWCVCGCTCLKLEASNGVGGCTCLKLEASNGVGGCTCLKVEAPDGMCGYTCLKLEASETGGLLCVWLCGMWVYLSETGGLWDWRPPMCLTVWHVGVPVWNWRPLRLEASCVFDCVACGCTCLKLEASEVW